MVGGSLTYADCQDLVKGDRVEIRLSGHSDTMVVGVFYSFDPRTKCAIVRAASGLPYMGHITQVLERKARKE